MGCVLCKRATTTTTPPKPTSNGEQSSARHNVEHLACDKLRHSIPANDRRRLKPAYSLKTSQGWPTWLCDVAGDAIKDWTPRRANTFEKIDKVRFGSVRF